MDPDSLTQRIYHRSDNELKKKLETSLQWIWEDTGTDSRRPNDCLGDLNYGIRGTGLPEYKEVPWIGAALEAFKRIAFVYMRDKYRERALTEFMQNVERVKNALDSEPQ